ncbi:hypothetical protein RVS70_05840 [Virgibacillus sp. M23]|uniref:hypothetical protein n=1 Tax=Virgibacillus sp. M23 TaxID=3079030 RepID=UPI002A918214|nr:hypothetical protein [Virgibacillus sp. M23]MDY7043723.1 hypothetical protein [Virgibacillus sp. M23]
MNREDLTYNEIMKSLSKQENPFIMFDIKVDEIQAKDYSRIDDFIKAITKIGKSLRSNCAIFCTGYDNTSEELFEIKEVNDYIKGLFRRHPFLLYYINRDMGADSWIISCLADEVRMVRTNDQIMNVSEIVKNYGLNGEVPKFPVHLSFNDDKFSRMTKAIVSHGKKIRDVKGSKEIAKELELQFA